GNDQARIKKSSKRDAFLNKTMQQWLDDFGIELPLQFGVPIVGGTECAHPARVWPLIAIQRPLVVARRFQQKIIFSVNQGMQRAFSAVQKLLENNPPPSVAETALIP